MGDAPGLVVIERPESVGGMEWYAERGLADGPVRRLETRALLLVAEKRSGIAGSEDSRYVSKHCWRPRGGLYGLHSNLLK